ncbi:hypothetical protein FB567DRAFT_539026 [Paraphoma chrysanthemicola]|uniref:Uncharacterized protein n=1 Tax=Paraphoma chrysanthemicola TaxID=798071 RepID=A0A8K0QUR7_9PLEO|nr:hypothetical protein FB567DRAFT_539026 [Paraphoma chrysanthemicola]
MKLFSSSSSLTNAAAAGSHADHGIPRGSGSRKFPQYTQLVDGLPLTTMFPTFIELESSSTLLWNIRGWNFQEKLLSTRILLSLINKCISSVLNRSGQRNSSRQRGGCRKVWNLVLQSFYGTLPSPGRVQNTIANSIS